MSNLQESFEEKFSTINNTVDTTSEYDPQDIEENKFMAILAYFGILVIIPILAAKDSKFARFHSNQGLILCILWHTKSLQVSLFPSLIIYHGWLASWDYWESFSSFGSSLVLSMPVKGAPKNYLSLAISNF